MSKNYGLAYLVGPVMAENNLGVGFYLVKRMPDGRTTYFVQETILPMDSDDVFTLTEILPDGKPGRVFTAPVLYADDVYYDISQTYEGQYDFCRCGTIKAACERRCPICRIERRERRQAYAKKVIAAYKRHQRKQAKAARRAAKQAERAAQEQAEFDRLRAGSKLVETVTRAAGKTRFSLGMAIKTLFTRPAKEPVQLALPFNME